MWMDYCDKNINKIKLITFGKIAYIDVDRD